MRQLDMQQQRPVCDEELSAPDEGLGLTAADVQRIKDVWL